MDDMKAAVIERKLQPYHSFLSSFFAGFAELGLVNQGSINIVSKRAAEYFYSYLEAKDILPDMDEVPGDTKAMVIKNLILYINKLLSLMGGYDLKLVDENRLILDISAKQCRICPKGVGGAVVKGTLCPIPSFLENLINLIAGEPFVMLNPQGIEKQGDSCYVSFSIQN